MWLKRLDEIKLEKLTLFNIRNNLHFALFIIEMLNNLFIFKIKKDKSLSIIKDKKEITFNQFLYWWQITRFQEITEEENKLIKSYEKIPKTIHQLQNNLKNLKDEDENKILETNIKIQKLSNHMKNEETKLKEKLNRLSNFKNTCYTKDLMNNLLESISICLQND